MAKMKHVCVFYRKYEWESVFRMIHVFVKIKAFNAGIIIKLINATGHASFSTLRRLFFNIVASLEIKKKKNRFVIKIWYMGKRVFTEKGNDLFNMESLPHDDYYKISN